VPPSFAATHAWVGPIWLWSHGHETYPGPTIFDSARTRIWATTTMLYVANSRSTAISVHVDCYLSDGMLDTGVECRPTWPLVGVSRRRCSPLERP